VQRCQQIAGVYAETAQQRQQRQTCHPAVRRPGRQSNKRLGTTAASRRADWQAGSQGHRLES
jgi:hypothetical protein